MEAIYSEYYKRFALQYVCSWQQTTTFVGDLLPVGRELQQPQQLIKQANTAECDVIIPQSMAATAIVVAINVADIIAGCVQ